MCNQLNPNKVILFTETKILMVPETLHKGVNNEFSNECYIVVKGILNSTLGNKSNLVSWWCIFLGPESLLISGQWKKESWEVRNSNSYFLNSINEAFHRNWWNMKENITNNNSKSKNSFEPVSKTEEAHFFLN